MALWKYLCVAELCSHLFLFLLPHPDINRCLGARRWPTWHWGGPVHTLSQFHSQEGQEWKSLSMGQLSRHVQSTGNGSSERSPFGSQREPSVHMYSKHISLQPLCQLLRNLSTYWLCFPLALLPLPFNKSPPHPRFHHAVGLSRRTAEGGRIEFLYFVMSMGRGLQGSVHPHPLMPSGSTGDALLTYLPILSSPSPSSLFSYFLTNPQASYFHFC